MTQSGWTSRTFVPVAVVSRCRWAWRSGSSPCRRGWSVTPRATTTGSPSSGGRSRGPVGDGPVRSGDRVAPPGHAARGRGADTGFMRYLSTATATRISRIGLGTWQFGSREWGYGQSYAGQEAHAIVRRAVELGGTLFDTAEMYGFGRSERILGEALGEDRESVFLATKLFPVLPVAPVVEQRAVASANRLGTRRA